MAKRGKRGNSASPPGADTEVARVADLEALRREMADLRTLVRALSANPQAQPPAAAPPVAVAASAPLDPPAPPPAAPVEPAPVAAAVAAPVVAAAATSTVVALSKHARSSPASRPADAAFDGEQTVWVSYPDDPEAVAVGGTFFRGPLVEVLGLKKREQKWLLDRDVQDTFPEIYKAYLDALERERATGLTVAAAHRHEQRELEAIGAIIAACGAFNAHALASFWVLSRQLCRVALLAHHVESWEGHDVSERALYGDNSEVPRNEALALLEKKGGAAKKKASGGGSRSDDVSVAVEALKQYVALGQTAPPVATPYAPRQQQPWPQPHTLTQAPAAAPQPYAPSVSWGQQRRGPVDPANVICFRCNTKGHFVSECPQPQVGDAYAPHAPRNWVPRYQTPNAAQPSSSLVSTTAGPPPRSEWLGVLLVGYSK